MNQVSLDELTLENFSELLNTKFRVRLDSATVLEAHLTEATRARPSGSAPTGSDASRFESFSLVFCGPADRPLAQGIHRFEHEQIGAFDLFIVPIAREAQAMKYQAVFNRLAKGG